MFRSACLCSYTIDFPLRWPISLWTCILLRHSINPFHHHLCRCQASQWIGLHYVTHPLAMLKPTFLVSCLIFWLSHSPKTPLSGHSDACHISCTTLIRHRHPYLPATSAFSATLQLYLRSAQLDTADESVTGSLGTPPSAVVCAALPLKPLIMFLSSALPFLRFGGLICGLWCK